MTPRGSDRLTRRASRVRCDLATEAIQRLHPRCGVRVPKTDRAREEGADRVAEQGEERIRTLESDVCRDM